MWHQITKNLHCITSGVSIKPGYRRSTVGRNTSYRRLFKPWAGSRVWIPPRDHGPLPSTVTYSITPSVPTYGKSYWRPCLRKRIRSDEGLTPEMLALETLCVGKFTLSNQLIKQISLVILLHRTYCLYTEFVSTTHLSR